jgi:hypothetical protein
MWCVHVYGVRLRLFEFILPQSSLNGLGNGGRTSQKRSNRRARDKIKSVGSVKLENFATRTRLSCAFQAVNSKVINVIFIPIY